MSLTARCFPGLVAFIFALSLAIAPSSAIAGSWCPSQSLSQPFSTWGDANWYALVPGQSPDNFDGDGWMLGNGARLVTRTIYGGASATVLELPSGAWAVSPAMCLDSSDQSARTMVRSLYGSPDLRPSVAFWNGSYWSGSQDMGDASGSGAWGPSPVLSLTPPASGPQTARFTLRAYGYNSESEIYNFYIDPYGRG